MFSCTSRFDCSYEIRRSPGIGLRSSCQVALAGIDSGGGRASVGTSSILVSIGEPFATTPSVAGSSQIFPGQIEVLYQLSTPTDPDSNGDGIPDSWGIQYFGQAVISASADTDGDGANNMMEYLAGTDHTSASSVFRPAGTWSGSVFTLDFSTVAGRSYKVWWSVDLETWSLHQAVTGTGSLASVGFTPATHDHSYVSRSGPAKYFFRIEIAKP